MMFSYDEEDEFFAFPIPVPTSHAYLPKIEVPRAKDCEWFESLQAEGLRNRGITPGTYSNWDSIKGFLPQVHDELIESLCTELQRLDSFDMCRNLYDALEVNYGHLESQRLRMMRAGQIGGQSDAATRGFSTFLLLSPLNLAIRYLIEMVVKFSPHPALVAGRSKRQQLIAMSTQILDLDGFMDNLHYSAISHEMIVDKRLRVRILPIGRITKAIDQWKRDIRPHMFRKQRDDFSGMNRSLSNTVLEQEIKDSTLWEFLEMPMEEELGYTLTDRMTFVQELIELFDPKDRLKMMKEERLIRTMEQRTELSRTKIKLLIKDLSLAPEEFTNVDLREMLPSENFWRDLRLMNRPLIRQDHDGQRFVIFGLETVSGSSKVFHERLSEGKLILARAITNGPVTRAMGAMFTNLGNLFRDEVTGSCRKNGFQVINEKANAGQVRIPEGIGPVDVFVVDTSAKRFVIGETKDIAGMTNPKDIRDQRFQFVGGDHKVRGRSDGFLGKLRRQEAWFRSNLDALKVEFEIPNSEEYSVEGVLIVNSPFLWVYMHETPLPIVDDFEFIRILLSKRPLLTEGPKN